MRIAFSATANLYTSRSFREAKSLATEITSYLSKLLELFYHLELEQLELLAEKIFEITTEEELLQAVAVIH